MIYKTPSHFLPINKNFLVYSVIGIELRVMQRSINHSLCPQAIISSGARVVP